ncbi:hypothetical protein TMES_02540 [Thalassospira mesophila]|uniref:Uncharacterized protein n=1 Tax=Thalassospira mesophila TaxID=1293891 RepID=A0A1Y2L477_9PROT|nr:hypothetical protein TMES_02540 [Thalassospira mesophila]
MPVGVTWLLIGILAGSGVDKKKRLGRAKKIDGFIPVPIVAITKWLVVMGRMALPRGVILNSMC